MPTVKDVAKRANVSPSTVSRYIRDSSMVSEKKALTIKRAITELGYTPNLSASFLKSQTTNLIGLVLPSLSNSFFAKFVEKLTKVLKKYKKQLFVFYAEDREEVKDQIKTLLSFRASSILFTLEKKSHTLSTLSNSNNSYFLQLFTDNFPNFDSVIIDDELGTEIATDKLIKLGHKRILLIDRNNNVFAKRYSGYKNAFKKNDIPFDENYILSLENSEIYVDLIRAKIKETNPTAIISVTEDLSQQTCLVLQELNLEIPNNISLICYDDSYWAKLSSYSVIKQPMNDLIDNIVELILNHDTNKKNNIVKKITLTPIFINRNSTKEIK